MEQRRVVICYQSPAADAANEHMLDPYQLFFKRRALYLDAYCPDAQDYRVFRLNRVSAVRMTGIGFPCHTEYNFTERHKHSFGVFVGDILPLITSHSDGSFNGTIEIGRGFIGSARMGKLFHRSHDIGHSFDALLGLLQCVGNFLGEKCYVGRGSSCVYLCD
ncbi:MAG: WYL domain-containing protein [Candidatus Binatia bacterium]